MEVRENRKIAKFVSGDYQSERVLQDIDGDGWCDIWCSLFQKVETRSKRVDTDGDGFTDYEEMVLMMNPLVKGPLPQKIDAGDQEANKLARIMARPELDPVTSEKAIKAWIAYQEALNRGGLNLKVEEKRMAKSKALVRLSEKLGVSKDATLAEAQRIFKNKRRQGELFRGVNENGRPQIFVTDDENAADTIHADELWPNGGSFLPDLTGTGVGAVGIWDDGGVHSDHIEFDARGLLGESRTEISVEGDFPKGPHATQVAGVLMAAGLDTEVSGVAYEVEISSYGSFDDYAEMTDAANAGMLFSNHSYGPPAGWDGTNARWLGPPYLAGEDPEFGSYTTNSQSIDAIAYFSKNFLSVWSSGNECNHDGAVGTDFDYVVTVDADGDGQLDISTLSHPQDGGDPLPGATKIPDIDGGELLNIPGPGFDTVRSTGCAKNNITVGNIKDAIGGVQSSSEIEIWRSSSRGPTDDGRIKPGLVANGVFVKTTDYFSDNNTTATTIVTGTSASAPGINGSLALLNQLHEESGGGPMLASSWKALLLNTAIDGTNLPSYLGTQAAAANLVGPDYFFGWGACDAEAAAVLLYKNSVSSGQSHLCEHMLFDGSTIEMPVCHDGESPEMRIMICWTDVPYQTAATGNATTEVLDPEVGPADVATLRLVNDLDLVVTAPDGTTTHHPWILDPANPMNAATTGSSTETNFRDNVEQVVITNPQPGNYTIQISHKGTLRKMTLGPNGEYLLSSNAEQAVSICVLGNKDPSPLLPRLRFDRIEETRIGNQPWNRVYLRLDGLLGVRYQVQKSSGLETWFNIDDSFDSSGIDQFVTPVLVPEAEIQHFFRVRAITPND